MIRLVFVDREIEVPELRVRYTRLADKVAMERTLSPRMFKKMWMSGNNGYWACYYMGWHRALTIGCEGDNMRIRIQANCPVVPPSMYVNREFHEALGLNIQEES